ncbi:hypothetical protein L1999_28610 [Neobacillus drentensis]|uniref:hypothetical protein n=1 Tax=Neobacillus drentensis TaxID=220684 RepID=UPI001F20B800|nr:hypothetical protein [Neobacillus drentensis]ULT56921.1 hypothetical protein L1999_28610 [Neobacillus drentensis]
MGKVRGIIWLLRGINRFLYGIIVVLHGIIDKMRGNKLETHGITYLRHFYS